MYRMNGLPAGHAPARKLLIPAVVLLLVTALWVLLRPARTERPVFVASQPVVVAARAVERDLEERIEALGTTSSWDSIEIRPTVTEFVEAVHFHDGQVVRRGDALVTLVQDEERARLAEARALLAEQEREVGRIEGLVASKSLSRNQLDERRTLRDVALARMAAAEAALADRSIKAPFDGVLGLRGASPGALVTPQTVITTLDDVSTLRLDFPVPSLLIEKLALGSPVDATTPALPGRGFRGEVIGIDSRVNPVDRSVLVRARVENRDLLLKPGLLMSVDLHHEQHRGVVIPEEAVIQYQRQHYVLGIDPAQGNRVSRRDVRVGLRSPGTVEVVAGLAAGDLVVAEGLTTVRTGDTVQIRDTREAPEPQ
jgi:membrane fusion protein (multidrug efflux system)